MTERIKCPNSDCGKSLAPTTTGKYRHHLMPASKIPCDFGGTVIPKEETECPSPSNSTPAISPNASPATSAPADAKDHAEHATSSTPSSPSPPEEAAGASTTAPANPALPGVTEYAERLEGLAATQLASYKATVEAKLTPFSQPAPFVEEAEQAPLFSQPAAGRLSEQPAAPMTNLGKEITARFKEIFYAYDNRRSQDNRSAQTTMGPSEMGTPCDRRLALSLMRMPPVNPGGDGWAAFVGTAIHKDLAEMFLWANHGTGRFAVETPLTFTSAYVPKGTADLIDRVLYMVDDHKCQGRWSRNKLKSQGPSQTYRVQAHVYAYGARLRGEKIEHIAIVSWPRDEATLDDMYTFTEPYNPSIVQEAFARVERIGESVGANQEEIRRIYPDAEDAEIKARVAANYSVADDCRFCKYYKPGARDITQGCNGKR